jgi:hypothetical protein
MHTPVFPHWRARLAAFGRRTRALRNKTMPHLEKLFAHVLPPGLLSQADEGLNSRDRLYSVRCTFWAFLWQVLNGAPCREALRQIQAILCLSSGKTADEGTSGYCQARARLPLPVLRAARQAAANHAEKLLPQASRLWRGWCPKLIDGTTLSAPDTAANQKAYPQSASQRKGCGFPLMKLVGIFGLGSGALLGYATGNKHLAELPLLFRLRQFLQPRDLVIGDRGFASYVVMALFELMGVACLFRLHQARPHDMRRGIRLAKNDRLQFWTKPSQKPKYLPKSLWRRVPKP